MPQDMEPANRVARMSRETSQLWRKLVLQEDSRLQRLISGRVVVWGRLVALAVIALLPGRVGRKLLKHMASVTVFFIYEYLVVLEFVVAIVVLAQMACGVLSTLTSVSDANNGESRHHDVADPEPAITSAISSNSNTDSNRTARRLEDEIQRRQLQQLAMAATVPAPVPDRSRGCAIVEFPDKQQTLAVPRIFRRASGVTTIRRCTANRTTTEWNVAPPLHNNRDRHSSSQGPRSLPVVNQLEKPVIIHLQLPIYVCNLTFWNDIHITVPTGSSSSAPSDYYSSTTNTCGVQGCNASSRSYGTQRQVYQIEMRMWVEANRDLVIQRSRKRNGKNLCEECAKSSHSVGRRRFECTNLNGLLEVHKNTFHAGRRLTFVNNNVPDGGINFKFETHLDQITWPFATQHGQYVEPAEKAGPHWPSTAAFKQQATFRMLPLTSSKVENSQQLSTKVRGSSHKKQGQHGFLDYFVRTRGSDNTHAGLTPISSCHMEAIYRLENRHNIETHTRKAFISGAKGGDNMTTCLLTTQAL